MDITEKGLGHNRVAEPRDLRALRESAGMTQAEVAGKLGLSQPAVAKMEREKDPGRWWPVLAKMYEVGEDYPSAPFEVGARAEWFKARNKMIANGGASRHFKVVEENAKKR